MRALIVGLFLSGCAHLVPAPPPPGPAATCASACANGRAIGCDTSPKCEATCANVQASQVFTYDVACLTHADTCVTWQACFP